jgi:hypothetical protein
MMSRFPRRGARLEQVLSFLPEDAAAAARAADLDRERIAVEARDQGLGVLLAHYLPDCFRPSTAERAGGAFLAQRTARATVEVCGALTQAGVRALVLKGPPMAAALYPAPELRPSLDVDLLVAPDDLDAAQRALESLGYQLLKDLPERAGEFSHHRLFNAPGKVAVELHHTASEWFQADFDARRMIARARTASLAGATMQVLGPVDELVYLGVHAASHRFENAKWLFDLKLLLQTQPVAWREVIDEARAAHVAAALGMALAEARARLRAPVPDWVLDALGPGRLRVAAMRALAEVKPSVGFYLTELLLADRPSPRWLARLLAPPARRLARALGLSK